MLLEGKKLQQHRESYVESLSYIYILYGTHTGNSEQLAKDAAEQIIAAGWRATARDMGDFDPADLCHIFRLLVIVSTDGEGEPPLMAEALLEYLCHPDAPHLGHISYAVLALGDSSYEWFCQAGKDFDAALRKLGARPLTDRLDCDVDYEGNYAEWLASVIRSLQ